MFNEQPKDNDFKGTESPKIIIPTAMPIDRLMFAGPIQKPPLPYHKKMLAPIINSPEDKTNYIFALIAISNAYNKATVYKNKYSIELESLIKAHSNALQQTHLKLKLNLTKKPLSNSIDQLLNQKYSLILQEQCSCSELEAMYTSIFIQLDLHKQAVDMLHTITSVYITDRNNDIRKNTECWTTRICNLLQQFSQELQFKQNTYQTIKI